MQDLAHSLHWLKQFCFQKLKHLTKFSAALADHYTPCHECPHLQVLPRTTADHFHSCQSFN